MLGFLCACVLVLLPAVAAQPTTTNVTLVSFMPLSFLSGLHHHSIIRMVLSDVNSDPSLLPGVHINLELADWSPDEARFPGQSQMTRGVKEALEAVTEYANKNLIGFIGPISSAVATLSTTIVGAVAKISMISPSATAPELSSKFLYPYFWRTVPPDTLQALAIVGLLKHFGFARLTQIFVDDAYGRGISNAFEDAAASAGIETVARLSVIFNDYARYDEVVQALVESDTSVFLLVGNAGEAEAILKRADNHSLVNENFAWIAVDGWANAASGGLNTNKEYDAQLDRIHKFAIGPTPLRGVGQAYEDFQARIQQEDEAGLLQPPLSQYAGSAYNSFTHDAAWAYVYAIQRVLQSGGDVTSPAEISTALASTSFIGASGNVVFNEDQDRIGNYEFLTHEMGQPPVRCGTWDATNGVQLFDIPSVKPFYKVSDSWRVKKICLPGEYYSSQTDECLPCDVGTFQNTSGRPTSCSDCPIGFFQDSPAQRKCKKCPPSTFADQEGSVQCTWCPEGSSNFQQEILCPGCDLDKLLDQFLPVNKGACECLPGYYGNAGSTCTPCPKGAACCACASALDPAAEIQSIADTGSPCESCRSGSVLPIPKKHYRLSLVTTAPPTNENRTATPTATAFIIRCHNDDSCLGGSGNTCGDGYEGSQCATCADGYYLLGQYCNKCHVLHVVAMVVLIALLLPLGVVFFLYVTYYHFRLSSIIILTDLLQVMSIFPLYDANWPSVIRTFTDIASLINFNIQLFGPQCSFGRAFDDYYFTLVLWLFLPFYGAVLFVVAYFVLGGVQAVRPRIITEPFNNLKDLIYCTKEVRFQHCRSAFYAFLAAIYTALCLKGAEMFMCNRLTDGSYVIRNQPGVYCYDDRYYQYIAVPIIITIAYVIGWPVAFIWRMNTINRADAFATPRNQRLYGPFVTAYREKYFYWDVIDAIRNFTLVYVGIIGNAFVRLMLALIVLLVYLVLEISTKPFLSASVNWADLAVDFALLMFPLCGIIYYTNASDFATIFSIVVQVATIVLGLIMVFHAIFREYMTTKKRVVANKSLGLQPITPLVRSARTKSFPFVFVTEDERKQFASNPTSPTSPSESPAVVQCDLPRSITINADLKSNDNAQKQSSEPMDDTTTDEAFDGVSLREVLDIVQTLTKRIETLEVEV